MYQIFRSFFTSGTVSGLLGVMLDNLGNVVPCSATGYMIGTVESFIGAL